MCESDQDDIMVQNRWQNVEPIENCTIILGNLILGPMEGPGNGEKVKLPNLRVITGFLSVYRVSNLKSLENLLPKLAVIEGEQLMHDQALIIYENSHLEDLGLKSLVSIKRGSVAIVENPQLCYIDNIDWKYLLQEEVETIFSENKVSEGCTNLCIKEACPLNSKRSPACWNAHNCQRRKYLPFIA